jgi:hypothetical protein
LSCGFGQVVRVLLERLKLPFRIRVGHALAATDLLHGLQQLRAIDALCLERLLQLAVVVRREEEVLGGGVLVLERLGLLPGVVEHITKP